MKKFLKRKKFIRFICICIGFGIIYAIIYTGNILYDYSRLIVIALVLAFVSNFVNNNKNK